MNTARQSFSKILQEELDAMEKADGKGLADKTVKDTDGKSPCCGSVSGAPEGSEKSAIEKADGKSIPVITTKPKEVKGTAGESAPGGAPEGSNKPAIEKAKGSTVASTSVSPSKDLKGAQNVASESFILPHDVLVEHDGRKVTIKGGTRVSLIKEAEEGEESEKGEDEGEDKGGEDKGGEEGEEKEDKKSPPPPLDMGGLEDEDVNEADLPDIGGTVDGSFGGMEGGEDDVVSRLADAVDGFADAMHDFLGVEATEEEHGGMGGEPMGEIGVPPEGGVPAEDMGGEIPPMGGDEAEPKTFEEALLTKDQRRRRRMGRGAAVGKVKPDGSRGG